MLGTLALLDRLLGMKSATDRLSLALACPLSRMGRARAQVGSLYLCLGADQAGVDWALMDHVICARPSAEDNMVNTYLRKLSNAAQLEAIVGDCSPVYCFASAAALVAAAYAWEHGYDAVSTLMVVLPLLLRTEMMSPLQLWHMYRLGERWRGGERLDRGLAPAPAMSAFIDLEPAHDECAALVALLLSATTLFGGVPETDEQWYAFCVPLGVVVVWLCFLGVLFWRIQRTAGGRVACHYKGKGSHNSSTGVLGGYVVATSVSDQQVPVGYYQWVPGTSLLTQDAGYGCIICC